jgi:hypothetical protein
MDERERESERDFDGMFVSLIHGCKDNVWTPLLQARSHRMTSSCMERIMSSETYLQRTQIASITAEFTVSERRAF